MYCGEYLNFGLAAVIEVGEATSAMGFTRWKLESYFRRQLP